MDWTQAKAQYEHDGYLIPDFRLSDDTLNEICEAHARLIAKYPRFTDYCPTLLHYDLSFLDFARDPQILDMVEQIIGPDIILWNMSFFAKPAKKGRKTPWHQDGEYWAISPLATCTVWIAVDDSTVENGCLRVIPGSHRDQTLHPHTSNHSPDLTLSEELNASEFDENDAVNLILERGQVSMHDVYLFPCLFYWKLRTTHWPQRIGLVLIMLFGLAGSATSLMSAIPSLIHDIQNGGNPFANIFTFGCPP